MAETMTGGCACGRVRFATPVDSFDAYLCHCRMCQRATGSVSIAFVNVAQATVRWDGEPDWFASSPIAERAFCARCGTSIGFRYRAHAPNLDLTVASFDDPSRFVPTSHFGIESVHGQWLDTAALPRQRSDEHDALVARWKEVGCDVPR